MQTDRLGLPAFAGVPAWLAAAVACLVISSISIAAQFSAHGYLSNEDSWAPMRAALALTGAGDGGRLYETLFFGQHVKMQYPPSSLLPLRLLDAAGFGASRVLNMLNAGLAAVNAVLLGCLARRLFGFGLRPAWAVFALGALPGLVCYPVVRALELGQIQIWLDLCFTASCLLLAGGRPAAAGAAMGFAALIKPQFLPLLLLGPMTRQWRFVAGMAAVAGLGNAAALALYGWHDHLAYLDVLRFIGRHGESFHANNSVNGLMNRLLGNGAGATWQGDAFPPFHPAVFAASSIAAVVFLLTPWLLRPRDSKAGCGRPAALLPHLCLATLCCVMASPVAWEHHYGVAPAMFIVGLRQAVSAQAGRARRVLLALLGVGWVFIASHCDGGGVGLSQILVVFLQSTQFLGGLCVIAAFIRIVWQKRGHSLFTSRPCVAAV